MLIITKSNTVSLDDKNLYLIKNQLGSLLGAIWAAKISHPDTNQTDFYTNKEDIAFSTTIYGVYKET
jgi:hypothetical protein